MNSTEQIKMLLASLAMQAPILIVCVIGLILTHVRREQLARAAFWSFLGFGSSLLLAVIMPIVQVNVQNWVIKNADMATRSSIFTALALFWSVSRAVTYAFLIPAILAGRPSAKPSLLPTPPPAMGAPPQRFP